MSREFKLYPQEAPWCSFNDYGAILDVTARLRPAGVVEFGPGSSTLALLEGGAGRVDCLEDAGAWLEVYQERLARRFPDRVAMHRYVWGDPLVVPGFEARRFDLALVDGPRETARRPAVIEWCAKRSAAVLVPTEDHGCQPYLRPLIGRIAEAHDMDVEWMETGALAGGYALMRRAHA